MNLSPFALIAILAAAFGCGWTTAGWNQDSQQLVIERAANAGAEQARRYTEQMAGASAKQLETTLETLRADGIRTEREIRIETVKPIFRNVCASDEYVRVFNDASDRAERALSGQPPRPLPDGHAPAD
ncbi:hypothetical protein KGP26_11935 [Serratia sp. JSRIV002]|uniref:hypothetical protein n=1 Tax=Serratia sp. JSRIV002 TaxID=2831894 RepID=UPI001CBFCDB7|nr:hypothetical protein [Serratia sp. JSRIV002]UAN53712.1 hypothetical protein KGP26_11935 [Serratia sp. JSRIV002]